MKGENRFQRISASPAETRLLGEAIGRLAYPGVVLGLSGDLGCGKTILVQGIAKGLGVPDDCYITSPTYTLIQEYPGRYPLVHVDLYRLDDSADVYEIGLDEKLHEAAVIAIEWSDKLDDEMFTEYISTHMEFLKDHSRRIDMVAFGRKPVRLLNKLDKLKHS